MQMNAINIQNTQNYTPPEVIMVYHHTTIEFYLKLGFSAAVD